MFVLIVMATEHSTAVSFAIWIYLAVPVGKLLQVKLGSLLESV